MKKTKVNEETLRKLVENNDGYLLYNDKECEERNIPMGWKSKGFKGINVPFGKCASTNYPSFVEIGQSHLVKIGDPLYFKAEYIGMVELENSMSDWLNYEFDITDAVPYRFHLTITGVHIFKQGKEYLFVNRGDTEFLRKTVNILGLKL